MPPEDPNNPGLNTKNPDLSSVPLPESTPIKSPYAPVGGTLGDVADDMVKDDQATKPDAPTGRKLENSFPTAGVAPEDNNQNADSANPTGAPKKKPKIPKKVIVAVVVSLVALILIAVLIIVILDAADTGPGPSGKTGSMFATKSVFIPKDEKKDSYALYDGDKTGKYEYEIVSHFIDGYALVRKGGEFGIIDEKGVETVTFGKYDNIVEYGGLYGATKNGSNELIDGQGRVIKKYTNEFKNYGEIERADRAAYTIFQEGGKKYSIYSPRGERLSSFESEDTPTISSTNTIDSTSTTAVVYSDGIYVYDDASQEVLHLERKIAKKYLVTDASADRNAIILSTAPGKVSVSSGTIPLETSYIEYDISNDNRYNATIVNKVIHEYDNTTCSAIIYERHYSTNNRGFLACLGNITKGNIYINEKGELTSYAYKVSTYSSNDTIFPLSTGNYMLKENANDYGLYSSGKKVTTFKTTKKDNASITYSVKNTFANNYVVLKDTTRTESEGPDSDKYKHHHQYELSLFNEKGEKVCSFDDSYSLTGTVTYVGADKARTVNGTTIGFNRSGIGVLQIREKNDLVLVNDKCQQVGDQTFYGVGSIGFWGNYLALQKNNKGEYVYLDQNGKMQKSLLGRESIRLDTSQIKGYAQWEKYNILEAVYDGKQDSERRYDKELLFYGKKTGISIGDTSSSKSKIIDADACLVVKAVVGKKAKRITNATFTRTEYYDLVETRVINNNGEVIFKKSEEVKNSI